MKIAAIVAARMGSSRLPDKVLRPILGIPILELIVKRLQGCRLLTEVVIATSEHPRDAVIIKFAQERGFPVGAGPEQDVLGRYYKVAQSRQVDLIVRITGDCPLIDPEVTDSVIKRHLENENADFTSNVVERTFPRGFDTEVITFSCLKRLYEEAREEVYREHVTNYLYDYPEKFLIQSVTSPVDHSSLRICVDTEEDFQLVSKIYEALYRKNPHFGFNEIIQLVNDRPELKKINAVVEQKRIFLRKS